MAKMNLITAK